MHRISRLFVTGATWFRAHRTALAGYFAITAVITCAVLLPLHFGIAASDTDTSAFGMPSQEDVINLIAKIFNGLAGVIGKLILGLIGIILIPILNYDGFATSSIVGLGWSLVRDTVNMFVVVSLLVIAILTIVGSPKVNWQQQIPRLFIYVVLVNFSRTICGFLIDIGNVIMFQFVNALVEIGAGNFSNLLKLSIVGDISEGVDTVTALQNMGAGFLQVSLMLMIFAIVGIIAIVFIYRIVVLWVLIILSPAAFFLGGVKDIFAQAGSAYGEWWKKFSSAIIIGPILSFFLWLALAASASGDIVTRENFPIGDTENFGIVLKIFDMSQLTGLLLGVILLVVGLQRAASAAGTLGFVAAQLVTEDMGFKIAKAGLKWPSTLGRGAYKVAETVAPETTARASASLLQGVGSGISAVGASAGSLVGGVPVVGGVGAWAARKVSEQGNKIYGAGGHIDEERMKQAKESMKHVPDKYKTEVLRAMAKGEGAFTGLSKWQQKVMFDNLATKTSEQKQALAAFTKTKPIPKDATDQVRRKIEAENEKIVAAGEAMMDKLMKEVIKQTQHDLDNNHSDYDDAQKTNFTATKSKFLDVTYDALGDEAANKFVTDVNSGFDGRVLRARALKGDRPVHAGKIRNAMNKRIVKVTDKGQQVTALHELERGTYGRPLQDSAEAGKRFLTVPEYEDPGTPENPKYGPMGYDPRTPLPPPPDNDSGSAAGGGDSSGGAEYDSGSENSGRGAARQEDEEPDNDEPPTPPRGGGGGRPRGGGGGGGAPAPAGGGGAAPVGTGAPGGGGGTTVAAANNTTAFSAAAARSAVTRARRPTYAEAKGTQRSAGAYTGAAGDASAARMAPRTRPSPETAPERFARERAEEAAAAKTVTPIASADAALEEKQAAANNNNAWEDSDSGSDTGSAA